MAHRADDVAEAKRSLRARVLARRRALAPAVLATTDERLAAAVLALPEVRAARRVAAYVSVGSEPPTDRLLAELLGRGVEVLLPVLAADLDLDWAHHRAGVALVAAGRGLREPGGPRLGPDAVGTVDVVVAPALAVDPTGRRLGRGGGSYDRALARVPTGTLVVALLHDGEVVAEVPAAAHDRRVSAVVTPSGLLRVPA